MAIRSPMLTPFPDSVGSGFRIGDGTWLSAGHNFFRIKESDYREDPNDRTLSDISLSNIVVLGDDGWRDYYQNLSEAYFNHIHDPNISKAQNIAKILGSPSVLQHDWVLIGRSGNTTSVDSGVITFLDPADLYSADFGLVTTGDDILVSRDGAVSKVNDASISSSITFNDLLDNGASKTRSNTGRFWHDSSNDLASKGDSGTAVHVEFTNGSLGMGNRTFVLGTVIHIVAESLQSNYVTSSNEFFGRPSAHHFSYSDFHQVMSFLEHPQRDNVTNTEPTNLLVGTAGEDSVSGSYRADIILGRGGDDHLDDGDGVLAWGNDQIFGGAGDDWLTARSGDDLLHGGDFRSYGGSERTIDLESDGFDTVNYGQNAFPGPHSNNFKILIGGGAVPNWSKSTYGDPTDQAAAIYVTDDEPDPMFSVGTDALVSIEKVITGDGDDKIEIYALAGPYLAGSNQSEPPRDCWRPVSSNYAAMGVSSSMA